MKKEIIRGKIKRIEFGPDGYIKLHRSTDEITICDICHEEINLECNDRTAIELDAMIGYMWPEGDYRHGHRIDICEKCFIDKVKPLLETTYKTQFKEYNCSTYDYTEEEEVPLTEEEMNEAIALINTKESLNALQKYNNKLLGGKK